VLPTCSHSSRTPTPRRAERATTTQTQCVDIDPQSAPNVAMRPSRTEGRPVRGEPKVPHSAQDFPLALPMKIADDGLECSTVLARPWGQIYTRLADLSLRGRRRRRRSRDAVGRRPRGRRSVARGMATRPRAIRAILIGPLQECPGMYDTNLLRPSRRSRQPQGHTNPPEGS